jgi:hypothetical protein
MHPVRNYTKEAPAIPMAWNKHSGKTEWPEFPELSIYLFASYSLRMISFAAKLFKRPLNSKPVLSIPFRTQRMSFLIEPSFILFLK